MKISPASLRLWQSLMLVTGIAASGLPVGLRSQPHAEVEGFGWDLPSGFQAPAQPADNPMSWPRVQLGRRLFYDTRLSENQTQSCASCHRQELAFTDGRARAIGSTGEEHPRSSMSLVNVAYSDTLTWINPNLQTLEAQALIPIFGQHPVELGLHENSDQLVQRLRSVSLYRELFAAAFPRDPEPISITHVSQALAAFERSIISARSPYDRFRAGDDNAVSASAQRGEALYFSRKFACFRCHGGKTFTESTQAGTNGNFHNTGLYNLAAPLSYPATSPGLYEVTGQPRDVGRFKTPTLRNVAITAPYMHDGSVETLSEVIDHYAAGGRTIAHGPRQGVGADNVAKSPLIRSFSASSAEKLDLEAFLHALTDTALLHDQRFSDPWPKRAER